MVLLRIATPRALSSVIAAFGLLPLSSCTLMISATQRELPALSHGANRTEIEKVLGSPRKAARFSPPIALGREQTFLSLMTNKSRKPLKELVSMRTEHRVSGRYYEAGDTSNLDAYAMQSAWSAGLLDPFVAPLALSEAMKKQTLRIWYSPEDKVVTHHWSD